MEAKTLLYEKTEQIAEIHLNRPKSLNAVNSTLLHELEALLDEIVGDEEIRAVIIAGNDKVFAAGADISELNAIDTPSQAYDFVSLAHRVLNRVENLSKPVIAAINGLAFGGGCELALACDLRVAADNASFAFPEIKLGILPGAGGTQRLPRIVGAGRAKALLFSGDPIDAKEAFRIGLVNQVVTPEAVMDTARKMAVKLARRPGYALATIKAVVNEGVQLDLPSALASEKRCFAIVFSTQDRHEGIKAFMEKREPEFCHR